MWHNIYIDTLIGCDKFGDKLTSVMNQMKKNNIQSEVFELESSV